MRLTRWRRRVKANRTPRELGRREVSWLDQGKQIIVIYLVERLKVCVVIAMRGLGGTRCGLATRIVKSRAHGIEDNEKAQLFLFGSATPWNRACACAFIIPSASMEQEQKATWVRIQGRPEYNDRDTTSGHPRT